MLVYSKTMKLLLSFYSILRFFFFLSMFCLFIEIFISNKTFLEIIVIRPGI